MKAANILRGKMDASEYKEFIFGMLFLKRMSAVIVISWAAYPVGHGHGLWGSVTAVTVLTTQPFQKSGQVVQQCHTRQVAGQNAVGISTCGGLESSATATLVLLFGASSLY